MRRISGFLLLLSISCISYAMPFSWRQVADVNEQVISVHSDHLSGTVFFTVTAAGTIMRSQDGGQIWSRLHGLQHGMVRHLQIDMSQRTSWFAVVDSAGRHELWHSPDNGESWQLRYSTDAAILAVSPSPLANGILLGVFDYSDISIPVLRKSENGGFDWFEVLVPDSPGTNPVWHTASVWQSHWGKYASYDFGETWQKHSGKNVTACGYDLPPSLLAPTPEGLFGSRDNLLTWWPLLVKPVNFVQVNPRNSTQMFTGLNQSSGQAALYYTPNSGRSFSVWSSGLPAGISDICFAADWVFLAVSNGVLYMYDERDADITDSRRVDGADLIVLATAFGSQAGDARYNARADLNNDGVIDGTDLSILSAVFGQRFYYDEDDDPGDFPE